MGFGEEKYNVLRKRLDQLGYRQTLDLTSLPLVEKLFADLLHTTESFKASKQQTAALKEESQAIIQQGDPYKAENTRLLRENNDLHIQIIKIKEETDGKVKELKNALRKSEHECADLQFLNSQYAHKLKALQKQDQAKSDRIQQLHERNMNAVVETPGGRRRHIAPRRPVLELNTSLPESPGTPTKPQSDPYMCDLLRVADQQIAELNRQVKNMEEANSASQRKSETLVKQVSLRDKEIDRLQHLLEGGRPTKAMVNDGLAESTDRVISHLNIQVEYLQQSNRELDAKLRASLGKQREDSEENKAYQTKHSDLMQKYETIQGELEKIKVEKNARLGTYETELDMIFHKIKDKETAAEESKAQHSALQDKIEELKLEKKEFIRLLTESQVETERFTLVVKRLEEDKKVANRQVRDLCEENKQLKRNVNSLEHITSLRTANIEQQKGISEVNLQDRIDQLTDENDVNKNQITVLLKEMDDVRKDLNLKSEEVIYYKQECGNLQSLISKYAIPARDNEPLSQLEKLSGERDRLKSHASDLQSEMLSLKSNIRLVTSERDNVDALYLQATEEVKRLRSERTDIVLAESGACLKVERDNAIAKLRQALSEKESVSEQLTVDKQTAQLEVEQLGDTIRDLSRQVHSLTVERDLFLTKVDNSKETIKKLEEQVTTSSTHLYTAKAGMTHTESQVSHLKTVALAAQRSRDDLHNKLSEVNMELELVNQRNNFLEKQVQDLQESLRSKNNVATKMKQTLVDKEKDQDNLLCQLDEKTEKIHDMNHKFLKQDNELHLLSMEIKTFEEKFVEQKQLTTQKDQEVESLRKQVNRMIEELSELESVKDVTLKHNKQLTDDVANMTSENQRLNEEIRGLMKELELMRRDVNDKCQELHTIGHMVGLKDADNQEILDRYRALSMECDTIAREAKTSAENCLELQRDLAATGDVKNALETRLKEETVEIQKILEHNEGLQVHLSDLELQVSKYECIVREQEEYRKQILLDLETVREINNKIEGQREAHARQAANRSVEVEQLQRVIENLTADCESLKRQVSAEKDCARNLEFIIKTGRKQEFDSQSKVEDNQLKVSQLQAKLQIKETELQQSREKYRVLHEDYDKLKEQNGKLLRNVTNERFEREKMKNEANTLKNRLETLTPKPSSALPKPEGLSNIRSLVAPDPVFYQPTLSPSSVKRNVARGARHFSSNDETDDSIMKEINRTLKYKTPTPDAPANVSIQASNVSSIMTSMTDSTADQSTDNPLVHHTETSIDSVAVKLKSDLIVEGSTTEPLSLSVQSSLVAEDEAANSEVTFDGDEDDSVYQAIRSSQRSSRQSHTPE